MEWLLRSQIHFELAKCDEEIEQLQTAEYHLLKAIELDDAGIYKEQLNHALNRLKLRAELYITPVGVEDQVAMILEQCVVGGKPGQEKKLKPAVSELINVSDRKNAGKDPVAEINTHSLLLRAAILLAPGEFNNVLESETFRANFGKIGEDQVSKLAKKAANHQNCIKKCVKHLDDHIEDIERHFHKRTDLSSEPIDEKELERLLIQDYKVRLKLWLDLARIARKQQIWDICRVSARFCLLYDKENLISRFLKENKPQFNTLFDMELMRNLAEAHFIMGEVNFQIFKQSKFKKFFPSQN